MTQPPLLDVNPAERRAFDYYPTPAWMTRALMRRVTVFDVLEPCSGFNAITDVLRADGKSVVTNDLNPETPSDSHLDATHPFTWAHFETASSFLPFWVVTNPPFYLADQIVPLALKAAPCVAMLLRLSWLEPTMARQRFLEKHPPSRLIVMPRHDFRGNGSTDSVTSAWFIWDEGSGRRGIEVVTKDERDELIALVKEVKAK